MRARNQEEERTSFQEAGAYDRRIDSQADVAMVYGVNPSFEERVARWREAGYRIHVMTGVSWGSYQDYVRGEWDGTPHYDDAQASAGGFKLEHGISQGHDVFYMMPSEAYARYLSEQLRRVVDVGASAIHLEEPEFWVRAGYSEGFKREWQAYYSEPWQDPASSPDARYRAAKLKQHLYTRTIAYLCVELKHYANEKGNPDFRCYVPTHSLINYAHWRIISPESTMLALPECDGLIGQVWTGTSRTPTVYAGAHKQRTFEAGYCEYAACGALVRGADKRLWQLADPIEDNPHYCWDDYRVNWECTVTASLLVPESERFEIMPWPSRIFKGTYPMVNLSSLPLRPLLESYLERLKREQQTERHAQTLRGIDLALDFYHQHGESARQETLGFADLADRTEEMRFGDLWGVIHGFYKKLADWENQEEAQALRDALAAFYHNPTDQRSPIPEDYATELQVVFNALADMCWPGEYEWVMGQSGIALGISDTLMFQRGDPEPSDSDMSSLYGLALPLIKHGTALSMVQLERTADADHLQDVQVLLLTYEGQKPPNPAIHQALADWVRSGHCLILFGAGDRYNTVREWWNQGDANYASPQEHLTECLGLGRSPEPGEHACGNGWIILADESPAKLAHDPRGWAQVLQYVKSARQHLNLDWSELPVLALRRGPYVVAAGMDEVVHDGRRALSGRFVNLFDAQLGILGDPIIQPDTRWLLYDLAHGIDEPGVIAAAGRIRDEHVEGNKLSFAVESMAETTCAVRVRVPNEPKTITAQRMDQAEMNGSLACEWSEASQTVLLRFAGDPDGTAIEIRW